MVTLRSNHNSESMSGTVMVDALVAVVIASLMVAIVVVSLRHSQSLLKASQTARQAAITMKALLVTAPNYAGDYKGQADGFAYQMRIEPMEDQNTPLCRVKIELLAPKQTKPYRLSSQKWCQVKPQ